jgi:D-3-phosphoglycerate dehydrogenase
LLNNADRPGMVGHVGSLMGQYSVNIASMSLHRERVGGQALTVLNLDSVPPTAVLQKLQEDQFISNVRVVQV